MAASDMIMPGAKVVTADGEELGEVADVRGDLFRVNIGMAPDFWLQKNCVREVEGPMVQIVYTKADAESHKAAAPSSL